MRNFGVFVNAVSSNELTNSLENFVRNNVRKLSDDADDRRRKRCRRSCGDCGITFGIDGMSTKHCEMLEYSSKQRCENVLQAFRKLDKSQLRNKTPFLYGSSPSEPEQPQL